MTALPLLRRVAIELGVPLDDVAIERFVAYRELLLAANQQFNLTRITDPDEVERRMFADSLTLVPHVPESASRAIDIGSGGGVPGLAVAIARPDLSITLVDATAKKVRFLDESAEALGLDHVTALQARAEELARDLDHRQRYDVVMARAVARLATLVELTLPFVAVGGRAILPKGAAAREELSEARYAIGKLGGRGRQLVETPIQGTTIVIVDKVKLTPQEFPRRTGIPNRTPLLGLYRP